MNFYPRVWVRVQIFTRKLFADGRVIALPDLNPTRCHPYPALAECMARFGDALVLAKDCGEREGGRGSSPEKLHGGRQWGAQGDDAPGDGTPRCSEA
jgi:hypothetical protein